MGVINPSRGHLEPANAHLRSEPAIVGGLAKATLGGRSTVAWDELVANYDRIRQHIEHVIPGFENYNARVRNNIFYLPNEARDSRKFNTREGKAKFIVSKLQVRKLNSGEYLMTSIRSHDQFNTTIYGLSDRYRGVYNGRRVIFMNPEDVRQAGLQQGQIVNLTSYYQGQERLARRFMVAPFNIPRGCAATYFPEANVLVPINSTADRSNTPTSKSIIIRVTPSGETAEAVEEIRRNFVKAGRERPVGNH
jgi:anaerobic selenocysteine-containing dehydrogenase